MFFGVNYIRVMNANLDEFIIFIEIIFIETKKNVIILIETWCDFDFYSIYVLGYNMFLIKKRKRKIKRMVLWC